MAKITITTRQGDQGFTRIGDGSILRKDDPRVETYGALDECQAALGCARAFCRSDDLKGRILKLEEDMKFLMGYMAKYPGVELPPIRTLEEMVEEAVRRSEGREFQFLTPGESPVDAFLHLARTIARRAERWAVKLLLEGEIDLDCYTYVNRLSDAIYALVLLSAEKNEQQTKNGAGGGI